MRFGAEELFKEDKNDEESKKRLLSMDIDEILERAEKVEEKGAEAEEGKELLSAFKASSSFLSGRYIFCSFFLLETGEIVFLNTKDMLETFKKLWIKS